MRSVYYLTFIHMSNKPSEGGVESATIVEQSRTELMQGKFNEVMGLAESVKESVYKVADLHLSASGEFLKFPRF
jgi:hypothetical protein